MGIDLSKLEAQIAMSLCESPELRKKFHGRLTARVQFIEKFRNNCLSVRTTTVRSAQRIPLILRSTDFSRGLDTR